MDYLLFERHPSPMLIYDTDTLKILNVNEAFVQKYKIPFREIEQGQWDIKQIRPEEEIPRLLNTIENIEKEAISDSGVQRHRSKEGEIFYVQITSQQIDYEGKRARLVLTQDITDQVEAESRTAQALGELQHHLENTPLAWVKWDANLKITQWSAQAEHISGYSAKEMIGKSIFSLDLFEPSEALKIRKLIQSLVKKKRIRNRVEAIITHKSGERIYVKIHSSALLDDDGELKSILTLFENITERKKSEIKYQRLFENANDGILLLKNNLFVDCNKQTEKMFKAPREAITGKPPSYFSPDKQPNGNPSDEEAQKRIERALKDGTNIFEWQHKSTEGDIIDVEVSLNKIEFPDGEYLQVILRDITRRKEIQAQLRKSEELFRNLFLKSPAALVMVDTKDRIQVINEAFEKMFGYSLDEVKGRDVDELLVPAEEEGQALKMESHSHTEEDFQIEGIRLTKSGKQKQVIVAGMPVYVDGEPVAGLGMYIDITERIKSEKKLKNSLEEKQFLLGEIHHRVKNNLAIISGFIQLQSFRSDDQKITKVLHDTQLRIKSIALVHELLYQSESFSQISLKSYIKQLTEGVADILSYDSEHITMNLKGEDVSLNINQAIPCALLINELLTNAYKHAFVGRNKGNITVSIKGREAQVSIKVKDDGIGLPQDFSLEEGESLGINIIGTLVQQLEADLQYNSDEGGTLFKFCFEKKDDAASFSSSGANGNP